MHMATYTASASQHHWVQTFIKVRAIFFKIRIKARKKRKGQGRWEI